MSDRELLELAAKAAGIYRKYYEFLGESGMIDDDPDGGWWNPLTDDGDALRLAVKCKLTVCTDGELTVSVNEAYKNGVFVTQSVPDCNSDHYAATRRAIVRAAAEIGKGMK